VIKLPLVLLSTAFFAAIPAFARALAWPLGPARLLRIGARACSGWGRVSCAILGVRREVHGPIPREGVFLVAANHLSYLDILVLASLYPSVFLAKREIASWPVFGWIARGAGTLFVDRVQPKDVVRAGREMGGILALGLPLTIFPEGRSTPGTAVLPFLPSLLEPAARARVPCWAVSLSYATPGSAEPPSHSVCWHDSRNFATHFKDLLALRRIVARVRFAESPVVSADRKELAQELWRRVSASFEPVAPAGAGAASPSPAPTP